MSEFVRTVLMLAAAGLAVSGLGSWALWWNEEERRLLRLIARALGGEPDGAIVARGRNAAAGFRLETRQMVVMAKGGASALLYKLDLLEGAEILIDNVVVARVFRGEARRALDRIEGAPQQVSVRMIFNDARHPDFELDLWEIEDLGRRRAPIPAKTIQEARTWLARIDALLKQAPTVQPRVAAPEPVAQTTEDLPPWDDADDAV